MITIRSALKNKGGDTWSVTPQSTILEALKLMAEKQIGAVLVMEDNRLVGVFSERDYARRGVLEGRDVTTRIEEVMTSPVFAISPDRPMEDCLALMTDHHFRHLPVVENDQVVGIISIGDVVKEIILDQRDMISGLENYIMGKRS